ncbi:hypothetical protein D3C75_697710 [compost metagenome]
MRAWQCLFNGAAEVRITRSRCRALAPVDLIAFGRFDHTAQGAGLVAADMLQQRALGACAAQLQAQIHRPVGHGIQGAEQQAFAVAAGPGRLKHTLQGAYQGQLAVHLFQCLANLSG